MGTILPQDSTARPLGVHCVPSTPGCGDSVMDDVPPPGPLGLLGGAGSGRNYRGMAHSPVSPHLCHAPCAGASS